MTMIANKNFRSVRTALLTTAIMASLSTNVLAGPTGGTVVAGDADFETIGGGDPFGVTQNTSAAIIEWQSFNIANGESFFFDQPSADAAILNRVIGPGGQSVINGDLSANGNVFIMNADGVLFGPNSVVDVNGLVATSLDIGNANFMASTFDFDMLGEDDAAVINQGQISIAESGILAFVAPNVANEGIIAARGGTVTLAAGDRFVIDFFGDGLVTFSPDIPSGENMGGINITGPINAEGGAIYLTATDAIEFVETIINVEADLVARSATQIGGKIILTGTDSTIVTVDATLDASGGDGGEISITGKEITITADAELLADGFEADFAGTLWTFQNSGFGGADTGVPLTGTFIYNADTATYSSIDVLTGAGASLPGANYRYVGPGPGASVIDFVSSSAADITDAYRLNIGFNGPLTNAGGTLNIAFGFEGRCLNNACGFPGFGINLARGLIGPTSIVGTPIPIAGNQNGGRITVASTMSTTFDGIASVNPGTTTGTGGEIILSSDGLLTFDGEAFIGDRPREGMLTLIGLAPPPDPEPMDPPMDPDPVDPPMVEMDEEEEIEESVQISISEIASTQTNTESTSSDPAPEGTSSNSGDESDGEGTGAPTGGSTEFDGQPIFEGDPQEGNDDQERQLMCLLGVAEAACSSQ